MKNKQQLRLLIRYGWKERGLLLAGVCTTVIFTVLNTLLPLVIGHLLDKELVPGVGIADWHRFLKWMGCFLALALSLPASEYMNRLLFVHASNRIARHIELDVYDRVDRLPISYFDSLPTGSIVSRITNDTKTLKVFYDMILGKFLVSLILIFGLYVTMLRLEWRLGLILLLTIPVAGVLFYDFTRVAGKCNRLCRKEEGNINAAIHENILNMEIIQVDNAQEHIFQSFQQINGLLYQYGLKMTKLFSYNSFNAIFFVQYFFIGVMLLYFGVRKLVWQAPIQIGIIYVFMSYIIQLFTNFNEAMMSMDAVEQSMGALSHIEEVLEKQPMVDGEEDFGPMQGEVTLDHVTFGYEADHPVLKDLNFHTEAGRSIGVIGATGSGKSTIMNLLLQFYTPQSGRVLLDGKDIRTMRRDSVRQHMAIVLQEPILFEGTIGENIAMAADISRQEMEQALDELGIREMVERHEGGLDFVLRERGAQLSQGEKQLIAFARAYVRKPKLLILDEATANIDTETEKAIQHGVEVLSKNQTTFVIAHRLSTIRDMDEIILLDRGQILERGSHDTLMARNGRYARMVQEQLHKKNDKLEF